MTLDEHRFFNPVPGTGVLPQVLQEIFVAVPFRPQVVVRVDYYAFGIDDLFNDLLVPF